MRATVTPPDDLVRWVCLAASVLLLPFAATADFSSTNQGNSNHFWKVIEARQRPMTVLSFEDSMADSYRSPTFYLARQLEDRFGAAGYSLNSYRNRTLYSLTNGASFIPALPTWFSHHYEVQAGAGVGVGKSILPQRRFQ